MRRRDFFAASAAAGAGFAFSTSEGRAADAAAKELIELRIYRFASPAKMSAFEGFVEKDAIPALNRAGSEPVGAFKLLKADNPNLKLEADPLDLYVLRPYKTPADLVRVPAAMGADGKFQQEGAPFLAAPKSDPAFTRYESSLLLAFDAAPKVEVPTKAATRLLQLRIYESHSEERARKKVAMFNAGGEIDIFRRCGMNPVFFGSALIGSKLPNLHYMLSFENREAMDKAWKTFGADPGWIKLKDDPQYKDTVSNITNLVLRPCPGSQI